MKVNSCMVVFAQKLSKLRRIIYSSMILCKVNSITKRGYFKKLDACGSWLHSFSPKMAMERKLIFGHVGFCFSLCFFMSILFLLRRKIRPAIFKSFKPSVEKAITLVMLLNNVRILDISNQIKHWKIFFTEYFK